MPRTLNATLTSALDSGSFQPYFLLTVRDLDTQTTVETVTPIKFKLSNINMLAKWERQQGSVYDGYTYNHKLEFMLRRGVTVLGVNYTIDSSYYFGVTQHWDGVFQTITASMLPAQKYTAAADVTYQTLIDALCTSHGKTATYKDATALWLAYKFMGTGKVLNLNRPNALLAMLKQKYLIHACDNGGDQILFMAINTDPVGSTNHTMRMPRFKQWTPDAYPYRRFVSVDETGTVNYSGNANDPLWNLGYLEVAAAEPTNKYSQDLILEPIAPHLKYLTFDRFSFTFQNYPATAYGSAPFNLNVEEEFDYKYEEIPWRINLSSFNWASGTEGGAMGEGTQSAVGYAPINTSGFDGNLNASVTNLQALADRVDEHEHTTTAVQGTSVLSSSYSITASAGTYADTGLSIALPSAGTYKITADVRASLDGSTGSLWLIYAKLYNSTDAADVADSARLIALTAVAGSQIDNTAPINKIVTVTAAKTIKLYAARSGASTPTFNLSDIASDSQGKTVLMYEKIG